MKLFPFDPAKAQTVSNPDGFPVYWESGEKSKSVCVFPSGLVCVEWEDKTAHLYRDKEDFSHLRLGPKPGKTVYLNCWKNLRGDEGWNTHDSEEEAKTIASQHEAYCKYTYIAIPVAGPEIEP